MIGIPRRTAALIAANGLSAAAQGQLMFLLPWMLLDRGSSPRTALLATGFLYVPLVATGSYAGRFADRIDPRAILGASLTLCAAACLLYPFASLTGGDWFWLVLAAAAVMGVSRNFAEGASLRGLADTTDGETLLRGHAIRTTVNQAAVFGSPFLGLLLYRLGGADATMVGIAALCAAGAAVTVILPQLGTLPDAAQAATTGTAFGALWRDSSLRAVATSNAVWNLFSGASLSLMPAVLGTHHGLGEVEASAMLAAGAAAVVLGTIPVARALQRRFGIAGAFFVAVCGQACAVAILIDTSLLVLATAGFVLLQLANALAAASLNGVRALAVAHSEQARLTLAVIASGMISFLLGVAGAAWLVGSSGFGVTLALTAAGFTLTALIFRRSLARAVIG